MYVWERAKLFIWTLIIILAQSSVMGTLLWRNKLKYFIFINKSINICCYPFPRYNLSANGYYSKANHFRVSCLHPTCICNCIGAFHVIIWRHPSTLFLMASFDIFNSYMRIQLKYILLFSLCFKMIFLLLKKRYSWLFKFSKVNSIIN